MSPHMPAELTADLWSRVNTELLAKAIAEFGYEELLAPEPVGGDRYRLRLTSGVRYEFCATRGAYDAWFVDPDSLRRFAGDGVRRADDALQFVHDALGDLGLTGDTAGHLVRELTATLLADARLLQDAPTAADLADASYAELEGFQTGHPWIVPNKGRMGFSASDAERFAPEGRRPLRLPWMAVESGLATYQGVEGLTATALYGIELDEATRTRFTEVLGGRGLDADRYLWLPVHPWQWDNIVVPLFAPDIAGGRIVLLGDGPDDYLAQQSIRTFSNVTSPLRHHVKLPLSILNTLVWRGLPTERTLAAPAVTAWVLGLATADPFLAEETRPVLLGEVASVTVRHELLESIPGVPYHYRELLGVIWRESINGKLDPGERARTLAALLYVDPKGTPLVAELVQRSGRSAVDWLRALFHALLPPLLHFLYRYGVVFSPHGENAIVVYDEHDLPVRLAVKDFVDDVNISAHPLPELAEVPREVDAVLLREAPDFLCQFIHSALFVGHFRYLAELCRRHLDVPQDTFWTLVRDEIDTYQRRFADDPVMVERFATFDLLTPRIERLCLNRNRLLLDGYRDRPERPHAAVHGTVPNPIGTSLAVPAPCPDREVSTPAGSSRPG